MFAQYRLNQSNQIKCATIFDSHEIEYRGRPNTFNREQRDDCAREMEGGDASEGEAASNNEREIVWLSLSHILCVLNESDIWQLSNGIRVYWFVEEYIVASDGPLAYLAHDTTEPRLVAVLVLGSLAFAARGCSVVLTPTLARRLVCCTMKLESIVAVHGGRRD